VRLKQVFDSVCLSSECDQAFRYFFVNRTVFGGRVNYDVPSRLYFSNPAGWDIVATDRLERAATCLQDVRITSGDYRPLFKEAGSGVWIYADPPYVSAGQQTRTSQLYQHSFTEADHRRFAEVVKACPHRVAISYDDDPHGFVRSLFPAGDGFHIEEATWKYCGTTNETKEPGRELLILNYPPPGSRITMLELPFRDSELSAEEVQELARLEGIIAGSIGSFIDLGNALAKVRAKSLHRPRTFEEYCWRRWSIKKAHCYRLMAAAERVGWIRKSPIGDFLPANEGQARELVPLKTPEQTQKVWSQVIAQAAGEPITSVQVRKSVHAELGIEPPPRREWLERIKAFFLEAKPDDQLAFLEWLHEPHLYADHGVELMKNWNDNTCPGSPMRSMSLKYGEMKEAGLES
jgi:hypothetical protein